MLLQKEMRLQKRFISARSRRISDVVREFDPRTMALKRLRPLSTVFGFERWESQIWSSEEERSWPEGTHDSDRRARGQRDTVDQYQWHSAEWHKDLEKGKISFHCVWFWTLGVANLIIRRRTQLTRRVIDTREVSEILWTSTNDDTVVETGVFAGETWS